MSLIHVLNQFYYNDETGDISVFLGSDSNPEYFLILNASSIQDAIATLQEISLSLNNKVDKIEGKGLSENDYVTADRLLVSYIPTIQSLQTGQQTQIQNNLLAIAQNSLDIDSLKASDIDIQTAINAINIQLAAAVSGYMGKLAIADIPTSNGFYLASQSGTYTNAGNIVVNLSAGITLISKTGSVYTPVLIPIDLTNYTLKSDFTGIDNSK